MKHLLLSLLLLSGAWPAMAFTSLHVFGDSASSLTNGPGTTNYYGGRYCNGRIWVEVLAQRQGLVSDPAKNWSFFGHYSNLLVTNAANYPPPADAATALFVVWVNNADFVGMTFDNSPPYTSNATTMTFWTNRMNQSLANHSNIIQTLYQKGARTLLMPNVVDLGFTPYFNGTAAGSRAFLRQRIVDYNAAFAALLQQRQATLPGLVIRSPDLFTLLDRMVTNAAAYGLTNALAGGIMVDALTDPAFANKSLNGPGTNHLFWDYLNPGAKAAAVIADLAHQTLTPTRVAALVPQGATLRLDAVNLPIGLPGFVETSTNLVHWTTGPAFLPTNGVQSVTLTPDGPRGFHRLRFPFAWSWP
ncbi:MAG: SGNH/GDSL hydrolase family protein [Limisphaerales bacterium]|jgi:outer membrane lipase/esterase